MSKNIGTPATFDFLGFTHYMSQSRKGRVKRARKTVGQRMRRTLVALNSHLRNLRNMLPFRDLHPHLCEILSGYYNYFGCTGHTATLQQFE